jgi:arabinofuranosyltransferase
MSGRFFSPIILIAAILISRISITEKGYLYGALIVGTLLLGLINSTSPLRTPLSYGEGNIKDYIYPTGIANERAYYFRNMGLLSIEREEPFPGSRFSGEDWIYNPKKKKVKLLGPLGVDGYFFGPNVHIIDSYALSDPLLSRLPIYNAEDWRIGHFPHQLPEGYLETLSTGENKIHNKNIALYYDKLKYIVRGDLYDLNRIREIINFNLGKYDYLLESTTITP